MVKQKWPEEIRWQMGDGNCWATDREDGFDKVAVVSGKCLETVMVWEGGAGGEEGIPKGTGCGKEEAGVLPP